MESRYDNGGRRPIIGGNWKMNTTVTQAADLALAIVRELDDLTGVDVVLCPPFPNLETVHRIVDGSPLQLGGQNLFWESAGAYTGEVSAAMLSAIGCNWVIVGHSERRHILNESNEIVNRKAHAALSQGLHVILAVGETREERHAGRMGAVLEDQLTNSLAGIRYESMDQVVIAYEPVWAIGTGETASPAQASEAHYYARTVLAQLFDDEIAAATRIQYGGSVTAGNAPELMAQPGIDGALVGGASLKAADFASIVRAAFTPDIL